MHDLGRAGPRYAIAWRPHGDWLELLVDGHADMLFELQRVRDRRHLTSVIDQIQEAVMEAETEPWPPCPQHYHELCARPVGEWIAWCCPATDAVVAEFGRL